MGAIPRHDKYGKAVLDTAFPNRVNLSGKSVQVNFGCAGIARIDGVLAESIAVEIESRASKQVRGALIDLIFHDAPRKLLLLLPVHMSNIISTAEQCRSIMAKYVHADNVLVVPLSGTGVSPHMQEDVHTLKTELAKKGWL